MKTGLNIKAEAHQVEIRDQTYPYDKVVMPFFEEQRCSAKINLYDCLPFVHCKSWTMIFRLNQSTWYNEIHYIWSGIVPGNSFKGINLILFELKTIAKK